MIDISNKHVAVVGNANAQFSKLQGFEIDAHDIVIRMNRCTTLFGPDKWSLTHGSKIDIWAVWRYDEYENYNLSVACDVIQMAFWYGSKYANKINFYDHNSIMNLIEHSGNEIPSTGMMVLDWVKRQNPKSVSVYGFDWKTSPTWTDTKRQHDANCPHNFIKEQAYCANYFRDELGFKFK